MSLSPSLNQHSATDAIEKQINGTILVPSIYSTRSPLDWIKFIEQEVNQEVENMNLPVEFKNPLETFMKSENLIPFFMSQQDFTEQRAQLKRPLLFLRSIDKVSCTLHIKVPDSHIAILTKSCKSFRRITQSIPGQSKSLVPLNILFSREPLRQLSSHLPYDRVHLETDPKKHTLVVHFDFNPTKTLMLVFGHNTLFREEYKVTTLTRNGAPKDNNYHPLLLLDYKTLDFTRALNAISSYFIARIQNEICEYLKNLAKVEVIDRPGLEINRIECFEDWDCPSTEGPFSSAKAWLSNEGESYDNLRVKRRNLLDSVTAHSGDMKSKSEELYIAVCAEPKQSSRFNYIIRIERRRFPSRKSYTNVPKITFPDLTMEHPAFDCENFLKIFLSSTLKDCCTKASLVKLFKYRQCTIKKGAEWIYELKERELSLQMVLKKTRVRSKTKSGTYDKFVLSLKPSLKLFLENL